MLVPLFILLAVKPEVIRTISLPTLPAVQLPASLSPRFGSSSITLATPTPIGAGGLVTLASPTTLPTFSPSPTRALPPTPTLRPPSATTAPPPTVTPRPPTPSPIPSTGFRSSAAPAPGRTALIRTTAETTLRSLPGVTSSGLLDHLGDPTARAGDDPDLVHPAASLIKLFIAGATYQAVADGQLQHASRLPLTNAAKAPGTGILQREPTGATYSVEELVEIMLVHSDNTAANLLLDHIGGFATVNAWSQANGFTKTTMRRRLGNLQPGLENETTVANLVLYFRKLIADAIVDAPSSQRLLAILEQRAQRDRSWLLLNLPPTVRAAHITGTLPRYRGDAGIIIAGDQVYIIAMIARDGAEPDLEAGLARASAELYQTISAPGSTQSPAPPNPVPAAPVGATAMTPALATALITRANEVWLNVVTNDAAPLSALEEVYSGAWLAAVRQEIVEMRSQGRRRQVSPSAPIQIETLRALGNDQYQVIVIEHWIDIRYDGRGRPDDRSGTLRQIYVFQRQPDGRWLIPASTVTRL